jgi:hypothetical protein
MFYYDPTEVRPYMTGTSIVLFAPSSWTFERPAKPGRFLFA